MLEYPLSLSPLHIILRFIHLSPPQHVLHAMCRVMSSLESQNTHARVDSPPRLLVWAGDFVFSPMSDHDDKDLFGGDISDDEVTGVEASLSSQPELPFASTQLREGGGVADAAEADVKTAAGESEMTGLFGDELDDLDEAPEEKAEAGESELTGLFGDELDDLDEVPDAKTEAGESELTDLFGDNLDDLDEEQIPLDDLSGGLDDLPDDEMDVEPAAESYALLLICFSIVCLDGQ